MPMADVGHHEASDVEESAQVSLLGLYVLPGCRCADARGIVDNVRYGERARILEGSMDDQSFALRREGRVILGAEGMLITTSAGQRHERYRAIRSARPGEYGLPTRIYYVACHTDTHPLDLEFPDMATRDRFLDLLHDFLGGADGSAG